MSTALGEAARMTLRVKKRRTRFLVPDTVSPTRLQVLRTFTEPIGMTVETIPHDSKTGTLSLTALQSQIDADVAGVYVENPNFFGVMEPHVEEIADITHHAGALFVVGVDILSLGLFRPPGDYGADIVISEGQPLGNPVSFGGPLLGIFACRNDRKLIYQMPGRLVGMTTTKSEPTERGFVLTLSAREQHIRREKATSNICSNQALMAVRAAVYLATLGPDGLRDIARTIAYKSNYAARKLNSIDGVKAPAIGTSIWRDFVVSFETVSALKVHEELLENDIHGGVILTNDFPELGESMLLSVTEIHTEESIDELVSIIEDIVAGRDSR